MDRAFLVDYRADLFTGDQKMVGIVVRCVALCLHRWDVGNLSISVDLLSLAGRFS